MSALTPLQREELLIRAVELRVGGATWSAVAEQLELPAATIRKWPRLFPDKWNAAYSDAERRLIKETAAELMVVLRTMLRSSDEKLRRDAARLLILREQAEAKAEAPREPLREIGADAARLIAYLDGHSDDELAALAAAMCPGLPPSQRSAAPAGEPPGAEPGALPGPA